VGELVGFADLRDRNALRRRSAVLLAALLGLAASGEAHELGPLQVRIAFERDGTYTIHAVLDTEHLPPLVAASPETGSPAINGLPASLPERTRAFLVAFARQARLAFDARETAPDAVEYVTVSPPSAGPAAPLPGLRWRGSTPPGARSFTWREDLELPYHPIVVSVAGEPLQPQWIRGRQTTLPLALDARVLPGAGSVFTLYLGLGFTHILPKGLDHILFVIGLFLLSARLKPLLVQVTAFTLAHTLTLGLSMLGVVSLPPALVEPLIAASIVYVAVENVVTSELRPWRAAIVFGFGLLHGLGFAGVLQEIGLPQGSFALALLAFNLGVEAGQLAVLLAAFLLTAGLRARPAYRYGIVVPGSCAIAAVGLYWTVERLLA
jgi:hypothetical protein